MNPLQRILVATDGSDRAGVAIELVSALRLRPQTQVEVFEVMLPLFPGVDDPGPALLQLEHLERRRIGSDLSDAFARLSRTGARVESAMRTGRPATEIVEEAERTGADLIVVGSRGRGSIATMLLGSVAAGIIDEATCPVLVARRSSLQRIVVADDGSATAGLALKTVCTWPIFSGVPARAVSVAPGNAITGFGPVTHEPADVIYAEAVDALRSLHDSIARDAAWELSAAGVPAAPDRRFGDPAEQIIASAIEFDADLIVMGTRGQSGLERLLLGGVARNVLTHSPVSVLIVRGPRDRRR